MKTVGNLKKEVLNFKRFAKENKIFFKPGEILDEIYNENSSESFNKLVGKFVPFVKEEDKLNELLQILSNLWNLSPHKSLNNLSPLNIVKKANESEKIPDNSDDWTKISDLLLGIQGNFQKEVYDIIDEKSKKIKLTILNNIHHVFQRYFYTAIENRPNSASYSDIVFQTAENKKIKLPINSQLFLRLYKTPAKSNNPYRQIRMQMGIEDWNNFPLIKDLKMEQDKLNTFYEDKFYVKIINSLSKHLGKNRSPEMILIGLWNFITIEWWNKNAFLTKVFKFDDFSKLLFSAISNSKNEWASTDMLFDILTKKAEGAGFDLSYAKLMTKYPKDIFIEPKNKNEEIQAMLFYILGAEFCQIFLTPLTTYFPILDIHYRDKFDLREEINIFKEKDGFGQEFDVWISKPPSEFCLKPLGISIWQKAFNQE